MNWAIHTDTPLPCLWDGWLASPSAGRESRVGAPGKKYKNNQKIIIFYHQEALIAIKKHHIKRFISSHFTIKEQP